MVSFFIFFEILLVQQDMAKMSLHLTVVIIS